MLDLHSQSAMNTITPFSELATPCLDMMATPFLGSFPEEQIMETGDSTPIVVNGKIIGTRDTVFSYENLSIVPPKNERTETPKSFGAKIWENSLYKKRVVRKAEFKKLHSEFFPELTSDEMIFVYNIITADNYTLADGNMSVEKKEYVEKQLCLVDMPSKNE